MSADPGKPVSPGAVPPLDDVMLAMDVVDTLRHRQRMVERELNVDERDEQLIEQLRAIYAGQGIDVSDEALRAGLKALKEERFAYRPPAASLSVRLARWYVARDRWLGPLGGALLLAGLLAVGYYLFVSRPQARRLAALPGALAAQRQAIVELSAVAEPEQTADRLHAEGARALEGGDFAEAEEALAELRDLKAALEREYELRIVSRPGERSGVIRTPDDNPSAENHYIIVEPIAPDGSVLTLPVRSEEDGATSDVSRWAMRVEPEVYDRIAADKRDDGIIQNSRFGVKRRGYLTPEYFFPATGASITSW
jgi:hypothetical protein